MSANIKNINIKGGYLQNTGMQNTVIPTNSTQGMATQTPPNVQNNGTQGMATQTPPNVQNNGIQGMAMQNFNITKAPSIPETESDGETTSQYSFEETGSFKGTTSSTDSADGDLGIFPQKGGDEDELDSMDGGASTVSTAEILAKDPLFLVLSEFFMDEKGNTIVHTLSKVAKNIEKLNASVERLCKTLEKSNKKE